MSASERKELVRLRAAYRAEVMHLENVIRADRAISESGAPDEKAPTRTEIIDLWTRVYEDPESSPEERAEALKVLQTYGVPIDDSETAAQNRAIRKAFGGAPNPGVTRGAASLTLGFLSPAEARAALAKLEGKGR